MGFGARGLFIRNAAPYLNLGRNQTHNFNLTKNMNFVSNLDTAFYLGVSFMKISQKISLPLAAIFLTVASPSLAATVSSDFSFGSGSPFGGTISISSVLVTLSSTVTQPFGTTSFRDLVSDADATVKFEFSKAISEFSLSVSRVRDDEFLTSFNIGDPDTLSGTLSFTPSGVGTVSPGDFNQGKLTWAGLNTTTVEFTIETADGAALALNEFSFDADPVTTVPIPPSIALMGLSGVGLGLVSRRYRKKNI